MKPQEIDDILLKTLDDRRLSRTEKQALGAVLKEQDLDDERRAFWRHRAFAIARDAIRHPDAKQVLEWLESVVKALQPPAEVEPADVAVYFSPGDDCRNSISSLLSNARTSADICVFTITDNRLADAILRSHERGIKVRIITDNDKSFDLGSDADRLERVGVPLRTDHSEHHMHHKFAVFDQQIVLTGSYNWTRSAAMNNRENVLRTNDMRVVHQFQKHFDMLWREFGHNK